MYIAETRPQLKESLEAISKVTDGINDSAITFIKKLTNEALRDDHNKTKTRILFQGMSQFQNRSYMVTYQN